LSTFKSQQVRLHVEDREFHFVSYEERPSNARRGEDALPAMWFLMSAGKRWPVMEHSDAHTPEDIDRGLRAWLDENVLKPS